MRISKKEKEEEEEDAEGSWNRAERGRIKLENR